MADRCTSTAICSKVDRRIFETLGCRLDLSQVLNIDGEEISNAIIMIDEQAAGGHYDELAALKGLPFVVSNSACPGVFGDHLLTSDGTEWAYTEVLSSFPVAAPDLTIAPVDFSVPESMAVRVECCQMVTREDAVAFIAIPKHTDSYVHTAEVPLHLIEAAALA